MENDFDFYTRRASEERRAAEAATHPGAQASHRALAQEYAARAQEAAVNPAGVPGVEARVTDAPIVRES